jgi:lipopolysaccharide/colanic/teichoic acid biosynthesis glycosyltransferase
MYTVQRITAASTEKENIFYFLNISKRLFDLILAILLLILLLPILLIIGLIIFLETGSNPLYIQNRGITVEKEEFKIFKFKTLKHPNRLENNSSQIFIKENLSELVTKSGHFLRTTGLDELPQIINILLGEMSFIGPRPLSHNDLLIMKNTEPVLYSRRQFIASKPGISGFWQIYGNRFQGASNLIELEEYYEKNKSLQFDIFLIFMTIPIVLFAKHSDAIVGKK